MALTRVNIEEFMALSKAHPVLDVRSPGEFLHAHIPGAVSLPLFTDEERKVVGTAYKQESKQKAIKLGLEYYGVKMVKMVEEVEKIVASWQLPVASKQKELPAATANCVLVHCWRGGMRSAGVAWLLDLYGYKVYTLAGGYKAYRKWVLLQFEKEYPIRILGGFTGSGKTEALHALAKKELPVIDLEHLAHHKGSAFGSMGQPKQPSQEMFENVLAGELKSVDDKWKITAKTDAVPYLWLEDESQRIGEVNIPTVFFSQMRKKQVFFLNIPFEERLNFIVEQYGKFEKEKLVNAIIRIKKKLGGLETKNAINFLIEDNIKECFDILLTYYDKFYLKSLQNRENFTELFTKIELAAVSPEQSANSLLDHTSKPTTIG